MGRVFLLSFQAPGAVDFRAWVDAAQGLALLRRKADVAARLVRTSAQAEAALAAVRRDPPALLLLHADLSAHVELLDGFLEGLASIPARVAVVLAGELASFQPDLWGQYRWVDGLIAGCWMETAPRVAMAVFERGSAEGVPGVLWSRQGTLFGGKPRHEDPPLHEWPAPRGFELRAADIAQAGGHVLPLRAGRGFPFRSLFFPDVWLRHLTNQTSYHHLRPVELIVGEAARLREEYSLRGFEFVDEIFPWDDEWLEEFIARWGREVQRPFTLRTCAEHLTPRRIALLHQAGLRGVTLSLEAADERVRSRLSNLNASNLAVGEAVDLFREVGVETTIELLLAAPGETVETLDAVGEFLDSTRPCAFRPRIFEPVPATAGWTDLLLPLCDKAPLPIPDPPAEDLLAEARSRMPALARKALFIRGNRLLPPAGKGQHFFRLLGALEDLRIRSPWKDCLPLEAEIYHSPSGSHPALGLRVPCQVTQVIELPAGAIVRFGVMIKGNLPGERVHRPVSFIVKIEQNGRNMKLFHKVLVQALDPDSRRWHWFSLPLSGVKPGLARLRIECFLTDGHDKNELPPDGAVIMGGWAGLEVEVRPDLPMPAEELAGDGNYPFPAQLAAHNASTPLPLRVVPARSEKDLNPELLKASTWADDFTLSGTPPPDSPR